jgi:hypothetical protein
VSLLWVIPGEPQGGRLGFCGPMELRLSDPSYTDRLANFLRSLGQTASVAGPGRIEVDLPAVEGALVELRIYLRVWAVLYPQGEVQVVDGGDDEEVA